LSTPVAACKPTIDRMPTSALLGEAVAFAQAHEVPWPRDPAAPPAPGQVPFGVHHEDPPPYNRLRGPVHPRGPQSGVVWQHGAEVTSWGEPARADLTFSVAKTYLALLAGVAHAQARIGQQLLHGGAGGGRQLVPRRWIERMGEPCAIAPFYGRLLWLNRDGQAIPGASPQTVLMYGAGGHYTWADPQTQAVVVLRWLDPAQVTAAMQRFSAALAAR
jgi:CubicO group peptidase (beta-lactamase class C family)